MSDTQQAAAESGPVRRAAARIGRAPARVDRAAVLLAAGSLLLCAGFVLVGLGYNQGRLIPPLDDVYIHLQYARQIGLGEPFRYFPGEPVTTGASSVLYAFVLGAAYVIGFDGRWLLGFAVGFGVLCAAATTALVFLLARRLAGRTAALWAGVLVMVSGPLLWGAASGMEVGLVAVLLVGSVYAFVREQLRGRFVATPVLATLLALTRPEGLIMAAGLVGAMLWTYRRVVPAVHRTWRTPALAVLPLIAAAGQFLFHYLATGTAAAAGVRAKSWVHQGLLVQPLEVADQTLRNLREMSASMAGLSGQDFLPPATLVLVVFGFAALWTGGRRTLTVVLAVGLAVVVASVATLSTAQWQNLRYLQPFVPLFLLLAVLGVDGVARAAGEARRSVVLHGLLAVLLLFSVLATPTWAVRFGQQASAMREGPVSVGDWLAYHVPPGSSVGVNDVGATAWFGGHRTVDLVGLTTPGMAMASRNGAGTLYEALRHLPPDRRPDYFAVFDQWGGAPVGELGRSTIYGTEPLVTFQLVAPPRPISVTAPQTCQIDRTCDRVNVWKADWRNAGSGDLPDLPVPGRIRDHVNVGDLDDEARHDWAPRPPVLGLQPVSMVDAGRVAPGRTVVDSARSVTGGETFTLDGLTPGRPVTLTGRIGAGPAQEGKARVRLDVNGVHSSEWELPERPAGTWAQATYVIPAELVTSPRITVSTGPLAEFVAPYPDYRSYGWWASQ
ncbi:MAG: glycosyltransferase family 39 protein [Actinomycetota bacterium]|nr:glycosyltransferase family 39 protein [Actinomycetota bacterium]